MVALNLLPRTPAWLQSLRAAPMYLGLDLRGVHFMLQVDMPGALTKRAEGLASEVRTASARRTCAPSLRRETRRSISGCATPGRSRPPPALLSGQFNDWTFTGVGRRGEYRPERASSRGRRAIQQQALKQNINTLNNRINEARRRRARDQQQGQDRIVVQLPGVQDTAKAKDILGRTATLEVRMVERMASRARDHSNQPACGKPSGAWCRPAPSCSTRTATVAGALLLSREVIFSGDNLTGADARSTSSIRARSSASRSTAKGGAAMNAATRDGIKRRQYVVLIEKGRPEVLTAPTIQSSSATASRSPA